MKVHKSTVPFKILFLFVLLLINGVGATLPIPNLTVLAQYYNFQYFGFIEAIFILILTSTQLLWGFLIDTLERKRLMNVANTIWVLTSILIFFFPEYFYFYLINRLIMALGLSAFLPLAYSAIADFTEYNNRGIVASLLNIAWVGSSALGILIGGFFSNSWPLSFGLVALLGIFVGFWSYFVSFPERGKKEPIFQSLPHYNYPWRIQTKEYMLILKSKTNFWLLVQGIFALIPGSFFTYWMVSFLNSNQGFYFDITLASLLAIVIASGRVFGYPTFGKLGDFLTRKRKSPHNRVFIATLCMIFQAIFFFIAFTIPGSSYASFFAFSFFFWIGSFIGGGSGPNRTSILFEVTLPEHRGTVGSLFSFVDQIGISIGLFLSTLWIPYFGYRVMFVFGLIFYLFAAFSWFITIIPLGKDKEKMNKVLESRKAEIQDEEIVNGSIGY